MELLDSAGRAGHQVDHVAKPGESEKGRAVAWNDAIGHAKTVTHDSKTAPAGNGATDNDELAAKDFGKLLTTLGHDVASIAKSVARFVSPAAAKSTALGEANAIQDLNHDFDTFDTAAKGGKPDGFISDQDLRAVSDGKDCRATQEDRDAAKYLLTHKQALDALDTAAEGGEPDCKISRKDLTDFTIKRGDAPLLKSMNVDGSPCNPSILHIDAQAPAGANWGNKNGNQAGIVSVYVDGRYLADATILSENPEGVDVNLGALGNGPHAITLRDSTAIGTGSQGRVTAVRASTRQLDVNSPNQKQRNQALAARYAPVVHLGDNSQAGNNVPLLDGAQVTHNGNGTTTINYSLLFSNEDGGYGSDPANAARTWGRNTDYQRVYSVTVNESTGKVVRVHTANDDFPSHWQVDANGRPQVVVDTSDNQYGWASDHPYRGQNRAFSGEPIVTKTWNSINLMNHHAWTWKLSTEELQAENKLDGKDGVHPESRLYLNLVHGTVDGRGPTFKDVKLIQVKLKDGEMVTVGSYHAGGLFNIGDNRLNNNNNVSVELPDGIRSSDVEEVWVEGLPPGTKLEAQRLDPTSDRPIAVRVAGSQALPQFRNV